MPTERIAGAWCSRRGTGLSLALFLVLPVWHADARPPTEIDRELGVCIRKASGGKVWLEKTLWGLRDQEGGSPGAKVANTNGTHDLGPLQINSWWVPRIARMINRPEPVVRHWLRYDACFNVEAARWIFLSGLAVTGDYWKAVGVYHSPTGERQRHYSLSVAGHLVRRFGRRIFD